MWYGSVRMARETVNVSFDIRIVPMDWRGAFIVPCTKGTVISVNVVTREVLGNSLLSVVGKLYGRVLIKRMCNRRGAKWVYAG